MMGRQSAQEELFCKFRFEDHFLTSTCLRQLDTALNFDRVRSVLAGYYRPTGRPSIDPKSMPRMLLIGCVIRTHS